MTCRDILPKILKDELLRREMLIRTIIATQAREGIETTYEQAERAYEKVKKENKNE